MPDNAGSTPAFPRPGSSDQGIPHQNGMTLRDWFAGQALVGALSGRVYIDANEASEIALSAWQMRC